MQTPDVESKDSIGFGGMILSVDWKEDYGQKTAVVRMDCRVCLARAAAMGNEGTDPVSWYTRASLDDFRSDYGNHLTEKH